MPSWRRSLVIFAKAYAIGVVVLGIVAYILARQASWDVVWSYQLLLVVVGGGYVFASILAWTGFANLYRYSPTLYLGSPSYREWIARGQVAKEGRDEQALSIGVLFGLSLMGTAFALVGWMYAALVGAVAVAIISVGRRMDLRTAKSAGHP